MTKQSTKIIAAVLLGGTALSQAAFGQDASAEGDAVMSVYERARPDYDAPGVRSGSFLFYPSIEGGAKYDSNIYAEESNVTDDFIAVLKPSFLLSSDWSSNEVSLFANADIGRYFDNGREDYEDFSFGGNGRFDVSYGTAVTTNLSYDEKHEDRGSADDVGAPADITNFSVLTAGLGFKRDVSVVSLAVNGDYVKKDFDDATLVGGGVNNNDDRDRERFTGTARVGYELADGSEAFIRAKMDRVKYDDSKADGGPQRNSDGIEIVGGAAFDLTGKAQGEIFGGYIKRSFDSDTLGEIDGVSFGASLLWNMSDLTSFRGSVQRSIDETTISAREVVDLNNNGRFGIVPSSGIFSTLVSGRVEHELRRNLLLNAEATYTNQDFELTNRKDDLIGLKAGVKYLVNRNMNINAGYSYGYRNTNIRNQDYSRHSFMVGITGQW